MKKVKYFTDVYCPWCHGFGNELRQFLEAHPEIELELISGGLFVGNIPPMEYFKQALPGTFKAVKGVYSVDFAAEDTILNRSDYEMNSAGPAAILALVKKHGTNDAVWYVYKSAQTAFYEEEADLMKAETYMPWIKEVGLDTLISLDMVRDVLSNPSLAEEDFAATRAMGVASYPTVAIEHKGKWYDLKGSGIYAKDLESNYALILKQ